MATETTERLLAFLRNTATFRDERIKAVQAASITITGALTDLNKTLEYLYVEQDMIRAFQEQHAPREEHGQRKIQPSIRKKRVKITYPPSNGRIPASAAGHSTRQSCTLYS